jgi:ribosomal protein S18 acetylase RimI-like enzyme
MGGESLLLAGGFLTVVREAEWSDLDELVRLHTLAREELSRLDQRLAPDAGHSGRLRRTLRSRLGRGSTPVLVAEAEDGGLAGCVVGVVVHNKPFAVQHYGYLSCLHVREGHRGAGVASSLLRGVCDWFQAHGVDVVHADSSARDAKTVSFWEARGFDRYLDHLRLSAERAVEPTEVPGVSVREARLGDSEAVIRLWGEMMEFHASIDGRLSLAPSWESEVARATKEWLRDSDTSVLVAEADDSVVGFVVGGVVEAILGLAPSVRGHVAHLCVTSEWRRRGVGRALFSSLRSWFLGRGVPSIHAFVAVLSPVSQRFWRALGFEEYIERLWYDLV